MNAQSGREAAAAQSQKPFADPPTPAADPQPLGRSGGERAPLRVLVVEDLLRVRQLLRELIEDPGGCEVVGFADTEDQAIAQYQALQPDAVIVDLSLRQGTGIGVITALRRERPARPPLLIVLTNHAMPLIEAACLRAGADHFLDKSHDFRKVRVLLEGARAAGR